MRNTYPTEYWVVTVYDDVSGYDKHAYRGIRIGSKFRHHGVNYVVTRYPKYIARSPSVPISEVVARLVGVTQKLFVTVLRANLIHVAKVTPRYTS